MKIVEEEWMIGSKENINKVRRYLNTKLRNDGKYHKRF